MLVTILILIKQKGFLVNVNEDYYLKQRLLLYTYHNQRFFVTNNQSIFPKGYIPTLNQISKFNNSLSGCLSKTDDMTKLQIKKHECNYNDLLQ